MDIKSLARSHAAFDGRVTFWLLPYRGLRTDLAIQAIEATEPQFRYTSSKTGKTTSDEPKAYAVAVERARKLDKPLESDWTRESRWNVLQRTFYLCDANTVAMDFAEFDAATPSEVRALAAYWQGRTGRAEDDWQTFRQMIGTATVNEWWAAYDATRDTALSAPAAMQSPAEDEEAADPQAASSTSA